MIRFVRVLRLLRLFKGLWYLVEGFLAAPGKNVKVSESARLQSVASCSLSLSLSLSISLSNSLSLSLSLSLSVDLIRYRGVAEFTCLGLAAPHRSGLGFRTS